jgi:hypothetical protein
MTYHNVAPLDSRGGHTGFAYDYHYHRLYGSTISTSDDTYNKYTSSSSYTSYTGTGLISVGGVSSVPNSSSSIYGFYFDGYPVYATTEPDNSTVSGLDSCNGHDTSSSSNSNLQGLGYHYHTTSASPYTTSCIKGVYASCLATSSCN